MGHNGAFHGGGDLEGKRFGMTPYRFILNVQLPGIHRALPAQKYNKFNGIMLKNFIVPTTGKMFANSKAY